MKNLFLFIACLFVFNGFGQDFQSLELPKTVIDRFKPIGENNGYLYYYFPENKSKSVKVEVFKIKETTLELAERKELEFDVAGIKTFVNHDNSPMRVYFENNKFYFFYCLISSGDFYINLTTTDENFNNPKTTELGVMVETGYEGLGFYNVDISPDGKSAIVALKNRCERKKAVGTNRNVNYDNTELVYIDLVNEKIVYSKRLPLEMEGVRFTSYNYVTDNEGNVTFVGTISKRKKEGNAINGIGLVKLDKKDENMKITEIDTKGSTSVAYSIKKNKQNDVIHTEELEDNIIYKNYPNNKSKQTIDFTLKLDKFRKENFEVSAKQKEENAKINSKYAAYINVINKEKECTFLNIKESTNGCFSSFYHQNTRTHQKFSLAFLSKTGEIIWHKSLPYIPKISTFSEPDNVSTLNIKYSRITYNNIVCFNNKMFFVFNENKPYDITKKIEKLIENDERTVEYDYKKENTVMISVDENGTINKKIVNDNLKSESLISSEDFVSDAGNLYIKLWDKKNKSVTLKKIPLK